MYSTISASPMDTQPQLVPDNEKSMFEGNIDHIVMDYFTYQRQMKQMV